MMNHFTAFFPLQVQASDFWKKSEVSSKDIVILIVFIAVIVIVIVVLNIFKSKDPSGKKGSSRAFPGFALRRLTKNIDLDYEQRKMLSFVFKTDNVTDPERSLSTPIFLDQHFKRAYNVINQSSADDSETQHKLSILFSTRNILENSSIGSISSTRQIKEDTKLTINNGKDKIDTVVVSTAANEELAVETPKNILGTQIKIAKGSKITVLFFTKNNKCFSFETRVNGNSVIRGKPVTLLAHSNRIKFLSHRRYRRRRAAIACFMNLVYVEEGKKKQRLVIDKHRFAGTITDISVGGCSIKTTYPVQVGARFKIEYTENGLTIAALGQVLRTNKAGTTTVLHIKFLRVTQKSMNHINAYVYEYINE